MKIIKIILIGTLLACLGIIGCWENEAETDQVSDSSTTTTGAYFKSKGLSITLSDSTYTVAGVSFNPPTDWRDEGTTSMRKAQFSLAPEEGDTDSATCIVFYFGQDGGGGTQANIDRWIGQMSQTDSTSSADKATQIQIELSGMKANAVEVTGNYAVGGMGMGMSKSTATGEGYLMVAVVLEGPEGSLFIKLTGPEKTATKMAGEFAYMMEHLNK